MVKNYNIETSLTLDYRRSSWGIERIVLDSVSNHLPSDSKGTRTSVKVKQSGGNYVDLRDVDFTLPIEEVIFEDNGSGYDSGLLSVLFSPKSADSLSIGQFGEGLKLVASAALRNGLNVEYRSRNWMARPFKKPERIGEHSIDRLCFEITENGDHLEGSRTVFYSPSGEFMQELQRLPQKILAFNDSYVELHNEERAFNYEGSIASIIREFKLRGLKLKSSGLKYNSRIIDLGTEETSLFVKGIRVQQIPSIFSYDLGIEELSPDRAYVNQDRVLPEVEYLLKGCPNVGVIEEILRKANEDPYNYNYYEFRALAPKHQMQLGRYEKNKEFYPRDNIISYKLSYKLKDLVLENPWSITFKRMYGEKAVIYSLNSETNKDAKTIGYSPIILNENVSSYLRELGIPTADKLMEGKEYKWVSLEDLTDQERIVFSRASEINREVLGQDLPIDLRVYSGLFLRSGREVGCSKGVCLVESNGSCYIGIKRTELGSFTDFSETYIHELGHHITCVGDYERQFTDFFIKRLAERVRKSIEEKD